MHKVNSSDFHTYSSLTHMLEGRLYFRPDFTSMQFFIHFSSQVSLATATMGDSASIQRMTVFCALYLLHAMLSGGYKKAENLYFTSHVSMRDYSRSLDYFLWKNHSKQKRFHVNPSCAIPTNVDAINHRFKISIEQRRNHLSNVITSA